MAVQLTSSGDLVILPAAELSRLPFIITNENLYWQNSLINLYAKYTIL